MRYAMINLRGFPEGVTDAASAEEAAELLGPCYNGPAIVRDATPRRVRDSGPHQFEAEYETLIRLCHEVVAEERRKTPAWMRPTYHPSTGCSGPAAQQCRGRSTRPLINRSPAVSGRMQIGD